ncbi:MAG: 50S ribosomal protein L29 [Armatimonadetes bacterium]|nr:50S ribosomal protein L29 [Anaerolineae bacterium]
MNAAEIRKLSDEQIITVIDDNRRELHHLMFNQATGELKNTNLLRQNKRDLARLKTVLAERRLAMQTIADEGK